MKSGKKADRSERMKAVEREHRLARIALAELEQVVSSSSDRLTREKLSVADLRSYKEKLEQTYLIRLFAEFETGIKDHWKHGLGNDAFTRIMDVIDSLASKYRVFDQTRVQVHKVRMWRNHLVHDDDSDATATPLKDARRCLGRFLGHLDEW